LLCAARNEHLERTIRPALAAGKMVLCDRFYDSTMAYQGYAHDLGPDLIEKLTEITVGDSTPELTFVFDIPVETGLARAGARKDSEDRYERMGDVFHQRLRAAYKDIAARNPERCVLIDADRSIEEIAEEIWAVTSNRFDL
jgi:dTMP kinase